MELWTYIIQQMSNVIKRKSKQTSMSWCGLCGLPARLISKLRESPGQQHNQLKYFKIIGKTRILRLMWQLLLHSSPPKRNFLKDAFLLGNYACKCSTPFPQNPMSRSRGTTESGHIKVAFLFGKILLAKLNCKSFITANRHENRTFLAKSFIELYM